ncbi:hypothetical protein D9611_007630 [Ephemerocybe angulata]|uniref:Acetylornithine transaminase n=1 Tax=Ephemerocybe angulata TaxID=980116 RepID=A0A8H5C0B3_9AGAR|nr:hypothetical protein D9611_007630 [Tulosesus angulatus]
MLTRLPVSRFALSSSARRLYSARAGPSKAYLQATHAPASPPSARTAPYLSLSSTYLLPVYARPDFVLERGKGSWVWDVDGKKYLDFTAGIAVNALGHADEGVSKLWMPFRVALAYSSLGRSQTYGGNPETACLGIGVMQSFTSFHVITEQSNKILHTSNVYHNEWAGKLAELLVTLTQKEGGLGFAPNSSSSSNVQNAENVPKVFFANSGTEANEGALKVARKVAKERWAAAAPGRKDGDYYSECPKTRIACFESGFHGRSMGALSVTTNPKYQAPFAPLIPGVDVGKVNQLEGLNSLVTEDTCAVIVEPVQGEGGIHPVNVEWLRALRKRCDEVGAVLIYDEIQCGLYRSGTLWTHSEYPVDCHPDIVTMAKPLANGYPIGAVLLRPSVAATMTAGKCRTHGTTFGGSPMACAVGYHVLSRLSQPEMKEQIAETSAYLMERLSHLPKWFPEILEENIRGRGFILGLGFKDATAPGKVAELARQRGVFVLTAGKDAIRLVPSLNVTKAEVDYAIDVLESSLSML